MKSPRVHRALFVVWGWLAGPFLFGAAVAAFSVCVWFGAAAVLFAAVWLYDMGATTCSRCGSYGTGACGVQAWIVPLFWRRKSTPVSRFRIRLHRALDAVMLLWGLVALAFYPVVLPFYLLWVALGLWVVYLPGRHHGLLSRLREARPRKGVMSLPVVSPTTESAAPTTGT